MKYILHFISILLLCIFVYLLKRLKKITPASVFAAVASAPYSLAYDTILGEQLNLYFYMEPQSSKIFIVLSAFFIYPLLHIVYFAFIPKRISRLIIYTSMWIAIMLLYEHITILTGIIVFTGWKPMPWSIYTYIFTYLWLNLYYIYLLKNYPCLVEKK